MNTNETRKRVQGYGFADCRDLGHQWARDRTYSTPGLPRTAARLPVTRERTCLACGTTKYERFVVHLNKSYTDRAGTRYAYPDGYALKGTAPYEVAQVLRFDNLLARVEGER